MIVLDDQLHNSALVAAVARWYKGAVIFVGDLRPGKRVLDPAIPSLLLELHQPTFVTINYEDFWKRKLAHPGYCIVCLKIEQNRTRFVAPVLREVLSLTELRTKRQRMGKVISWRDGEIKWLPV